jgi:UDP-3-O-[3-hydroxymyristoyl] glucosamine N-acyltransferase
LDLTINDKVYSVKGTSPIGALKPEHLSYIISQKHLDLMKPLESNAYVLCPKKFPISRFVEWSTNEFIPVDNPELTFLLLHNQIYPEHPYYNNGIHPASIIYQDVPLIIGDNCWIDAGAVIGSQGFKHVRDFHKVPHRLNHVGGVKLGDNVEIGAGACVDRASFYDTFTTIDDNVKIDNNVHIAHNVHVKKNTIIIANSIIGGSVVIGENCELGENVKIRDNITIGNNVFIAMGSVVTQDVKDNEQVAGNFAIRKDKWIDFIKKLAR